MNDRRKIVIIGTGGTIAGSSASAADLTGYRAGSLSIEALTSSVASLADYGPFAAEQFSNIDSSDMTVDHWERLAATVRERLSQADVAGVVITHGTDSMEETAYFFHLTVASAKPVVITGAMRPATAISADGPLNLLQAVQTARSPQARGKGVLVVMNGQIHGAREVTKQFTTDVATFGNPVFGIQGIVQEGNAYFYQTSTRRHTENSAFGSVNLKNLPSVAILSLYAGIDVKTVEAVLATKPAGVVVAGLGHGIFPDPVRRVLQQLDIPVVRASRTTGGLITAGGDADNHWITADTLSPAKARILLMLGLTQTTDKRQLQSYFETH